MQPHRIPAALMLLAVLLPPAVAPAVEVQSTAADQHGMTVTVYNHNQALVHDQREVSLPAGMNTLIFRDVSGRLRPETAFLRGEGVKVLEKNFDDDLLTPETLLARHLGKDISVIHSHPTTGVESRETARVLSVNNGVVLRLGDRIETGIPGRLAFPAVPDTLRERPALTLLVESEQAGPKQVTLSYLTEGLSWQADYIAQLAADGESLALAGWATLTNASGISFRDARLHLMAGQVHRADAPAPRPAMARAAMMMAPVPAAPSPAMSEATFADYHLYTVGRPTTIGENQRKQVAMLHVTGVPCLPEYVVQDDDAPLRRQDGTAMRKVRVGSFLKVHNSQKANLGSVLPAGTLRIFRPDSSGALQLVGEDRIEHTRENDILRLQLGDSFDVGAERRQTSFTRIAGGDRNRDAVTESGHEIVLHNSRAEEVTVQVVETLHGDWKILEESAPHRQESSSRVVWPLTVPARGRAVLSYRVRINS